MTTARRLPLPATPLQASSQRLTISASVALTQIKMTDPVRVKRDPMRFVPASHDVGNDLKADVLERALIGLINESVAPLPKSRQRAQGMCSCTSKP